MSIARNSSLASNSGKKHAPINPQELRVNKKKQKRKRPKTTPATPKVNDGNPLDDTQTAHVVPSKDMKELKEDIKRRDILSNLSTEVVEDDAINIITAKEYSSRMEPFATEDPMKERHAKLDEISQLAKELKSKFTKAHKEVDNWNMKYRKRVADMHLDVTGYEKKVKKKLNVEKIRINELQLLAAQNYQKRQWIEDKFTTMAFESPETNLVKPLAELALTIIERALWAAGLTRDFFRRR